MNWQKINNYYAKNGDFTLTNASHTAAPKPFGLYRNNERIGHYKTQLEALEVFNNITKGTK